MYFKHDSWDEFYKNPFGAAEIGKEVTFRVRSNETMNIMLHTNFRDHDNYYPMIQSPEDPEVFEVTIPMPASTGLLWYDFHFDAFNSHYIYGAPPDGFGGEGQVNLFSDQSYQITVYSPERKIPEWFKEGVIYQIFPDRFNHGDREDFTPVYPKHTILHTNWTDKPHYFRKPDGSIDYYDFFGGNLQGIIDKLDYLEDLGISIIYLNPIFQSCSNHKYDTADYKKIAPEFGNLEIFEELCQEAKKRGIRIILDGVFNHTGDNSRYFNKYNVYPEVGAYQDKQSPYYSWYNFINHPDEYESWWGIKSMPSTNKNNDNLRHFIFSGDNSIIRYWIKKGASGWRLDVADELTDDFIVGIKEALLTEDPDSILIGEVWEDASNKVSYGKLRDYLLGRELDSVMNYPFRLCMLDFFKGYRNSDQVMRQLMSLYEHYPRENFMSNMNLIGSHDRRRILTALANIPTNIELSEIERENFSLTVEDYYLAKKRLMLLMLIQMTFPGVPSIYYGDETGAQGFEDPYNRATLNWENIDQEIHDWYKELIHLRNKSDVLRKGDFKPVFGPDDIFAFTRTYKDKTYLIAVNRNPYNAQSFNYPIEGKGGRNLFTGDLKTLDQINVSPFGYVLFEILNDEKDLDV